MDNKPKIKTEDKAAVPTDRRLKKKGDKSKKFGKPSDSDFKGEHADLAGYTYTYDPHTRTDQFDRTTKFIVEYIKKECQFPKDIAKCLLSLTEPNTDEWRPKSQTLTEKEKGDTDLVEMLRQIKNEEVKRYVRRKEVLEDNKCMAYTLILGQCSKALKAKLKGQDDWEACEENSDVIQLLSSIKVWMMNHQDTLYPTMASANTISTIFKMYQYRHENLEDFRTRFETAVEVFDHIGVNFGAGLTKLTNEVLAESKLRRETATLEQLKEAEKKSFERLTACLFVKAADRTRYDAIITQLENLYAGGLDQYPKTITEAYSRLSVWKRDTKRSETPFNDGITFAQGVTDDGSQNKTHRDRSKDHCYSCGQLGHHAWEGKCDPEDALENAETSNAMGEAEGVSTSETDTEDEASGNDEAVATMEQLEGYEYAFCTGADETDVGHAMSQRGELKETIRTSSFSATRAPVIPSGSVGLDSMSSVDLFSDRRLLHNIHTVEDGIRIICNAGTVLVTQMGTFKGYGKVWYHPGAIANILSLSNVQKVYRVTYDSAEGNQFVVHRDDGTSRVFKATDKGLYASEVEGTRRGVALISTVKENSQSYTRREVKRAREARRLMAIIGRPTEKRMLEIVSKRLLPNCPVTGQDVVNARNIFGPDVGSLKGKTVRRPEQHVELKLMQIPNDIMERHREVVICFDVMFVNGVSFLVSISRAIKFCTAEALANRRGATLLVGLKRIKSTYSRRGFLVNRAAADNEFAVLENGLAEVGVVLNVVARDEHVPEIERHIRTLKERCRAIYNTLPFTRMPKRMVTELVYNATFWLHAFPVEDGLSDTISPRELITGIMVDAAKHCVLAFGAYVQTHEEHDNSMATRTIGAIALRPSGNEQGGHYFMSLQSGRRLIRNRWTEIPMPADVIQRIHAMAQSNAFNRLVFGDRENEQTHQEPDAEDEEESDESDGSSSSSSNSNDDETHGGSDDNGVSSNDAQAEEHETPDQAHDEQPPEGEEEDDGGNAGVRRRIKVEESAAEQWQRKVENEPPEKTAITEPGAHVDNSSAASGDENGVATPIAEIARRSGSSHVDTSAAGAGHGNGSSSGATLNAEYDRRYGQRSGQHNLRPRRAPKVNYKECGAQTIEGLLLAQVDGRAHAPRFSVSQLASVQQSLEPMLCTVLTQYGMRRGLKLFGTEGDDAVRRELQQIHDREVLRPQSGSQLTEADRRAALQYLMFLKQKRSGSIKGRGCADGRKQREYITKEEASSPTISTEAVLIIVTIAAKENRDVASMDIPGAFMHIKMDGERVLVRFEGRMAELLAMIDPGLYRKHIIIERGKSVLYAELQKVLYGMLQASLKFWRQVTTDLVGLGYVINPYDWCVANKTIDGAQHTVGWHVDDFIMTHENPKVNDELIAWFQNKYGELSPLSVTRGHKHDYLGMSLDFSSPGEVAVSMVVYTIEIIEQAPAEWTGEATTPAANHLFEVRDEAIKLEEERANLFHHIVAKALFLCKRARPDLHLAVGFLCTRVQAPDEDDWKKLRRLVQYMRGTRTMCLTLSADENRIVKWWVDASFGVHNDLRSQTGGTMSLGKGMVYSASTRQKLNTKSSTEAELVGASDLLPQVLWTRYFLEAQGYGVKDNVLYQDNQSAMLLEQNGRGSSSKRTRHINVRFFFITDRIQTGEVSVRYCPTGEMVGDYFTKPLQGLKFHQFRDLILNLKHDPTRQDE